MLLNVICCCLFSVVSFVFFLERISFEEKQLIKLFGRDYEVYRHRVRTIGCVSIEVGVAGDRSLAVGVWFHVYVYWLCLPACLISVVLSIKAVPSYSLC